MAEGCLQQPGGKKQIKDLGSEYFDDLVSRSFFQQSSMDESHFIMHDLINDLALYASKGVCISLNNKFEIDKQSTDLAKKATFHLLVMNLTALKYLRLS